MKQFFYKKWVKLCTAIVCILSFNFMAGSFLILLAGESENFYNRSEKEIWEEAKDVICNKYSVAAAADFKNDFGMKELSGTNFRYGVIQTDSLDELDLNDRSIYKVCNFDQMVTKDMLYVHTYSLGDFTEFQVGKGLSDSFFVYNETHFQNVKNTIEDVFYAWDTDRFYAKARDCIYPVTPYVEADFNAQDRVISDVQENGDVIYFWNYPELAAEEYEAEEAARQERIYLSGQIWELSDIPIVLQKDVPELGQSISNDVDDTNYEDFTVEDGYIVTSIYDEETTKPYYVLSYVREPLDTNGDFFKTNIFGKLKTWNSQDFFVQSKSMIQTFFFLRYIAFGTLLVSGILFLLSFCILILAAGHRGLQDVTAGQLEKIPFDLFLIGVLCIFTVMAWIAESCIRWIDIQISVWAWAILILLAEILVIVCCMDAAIRFKLGKWWKNTVCCRICTKAVRLLKKILEKLNCAFPLIWKAWIVMAALALLELIGLSATLYNSEMQIFLWFLEKVVLYGFLTLCLLQMKQLQQTGEKLAAGEMDSRLDTRRMFWDFKKHGNNLNNIREGIRRAVAEQIKSERFQTELITNVSHDIKTPLTSIINYVDLMEKEDIENPTVQEYLEVLSRQSTRLKKLIEDLIEASKASAGSLAISWENCDAQVMLTQTIGEFEEKLKANQIELIVQSSAESLMISADPRHLWRIFDNLMNNICKYAQPSTRAYVNIERDEQIERIIFRNISRYALNIDSEELMKRFVRGDSSRNTEGNGLGISIAKSLTELMGGEFELIVDGDLFKVILTFPAMG